MNEIKRNALGNMVVIMFKGVQPQQKIVTKRNGKDKKNFFFFCLANTMFD